MRAKSIGLKSQSRRSTSILFVAFVILVLLAGCATTATPQEPAVPVTAATNTPAPAPTMAAATEAPAAAAPAEVKLKFAQSDEFGQYLVDDKGMALYLFTKDTPGKSNCEGDCLAAWPPVLVAEGGKITVDGADQSLFTTTTRSDGSTQVVFNGWPIYYWVNDKKAGDTTGQGVGDVWYLLDPNGKGIGMPGAESSSSNASAAPDEVYLKFSENAEYGKYLVDEKGMALYLFTKDTPGKSNCEGDCLAKWPPVLVAKDGKVEIDGADETLISTITRSDGSTQVAFNGYPLYYWVNDKTPSDTTGQGVGEVWYLLDPNGKGIGMPGAQSDDSGYSYEDTPKSSASSSTMDEVKLKVSETPALGRFLVDDKGMTLYLFTKDTPGVSNCEGDCLVKWPPLLVAKGAKVEIDGMDEEGVLGTITRSDGTVQVTYKDMPLYYWVNDKKPGDTTGHEVGGVWFVVEP